MEVGWMTTGSGRCPKCGKMMTLQYDDDTDTMDALKSYRFDNLEKVETSK